MKTTTQLSRRLIAALTISALIATAIEFLVPIMLVKLFDLEASYVAICRAIILSAPLMFTLLAGIHADKYSFLNIAVYSLLARTFTLGILVVFLFLNLQSPLLLVCLAFFISTSTIYFDIAAASTVPRLFTGPQLIRVNAYFEISLSIAFLLGPWIAGTLFDIVGPTRIFMLLAFITLSLSFFVQYSMSELATVAPQHPIDNGFLYGLIRLWDDPIKKSITQSAVIFNFFHSMFFSLFVVYAIRQLSLSPTNIGLIMAIAALCGLITGAVSERIISRFRTYPSAVTSMATITVAGVLLLLSFAMRLPDSYMVYIVVVVFCVWESAVVINLISEATIRQITTASEEIGRVASASRFLSLGVEPLGAIAGALFAYYLTTSETISLATLGMCLAIVPLVHAGSRHAANSLNM